MVALNKQLAEMISAGKIVAIAKYFEGYVDQIKYTDKITGKTAEITQLKLTVGLQTERGRKIVIASMRAADRASAEARLASLGLIEGSQVIIDIDQVITTAPVGGKGEWSTALKIQGAYPLDIPLTATVTAVQPVQNAK